MQIQVDENIQKSAAGIFADMGLDISTAVNLFLKETVERNRKPTFSSTPRKEGIIAQKSTDTAWLATSWHSLETPAFLAREEMHDRF